MNKKNIKIPLQIFLLDVILIFTTKFFQSTPFETAFFRLQAVFLLFMLFFIFVYIADILMHQKNINSKVLYFLSIVIIIPFYSAYRAHVEFGQPYIYGILSQRSWLILAVGIWFYYSLTTKKISLSTMEQAFLFMAWTSLIVFSLFALTFDPSQLTGDEKFARLTEDRGVRFKFQKFFITFGSIYYFIKYSMHKKTVDLLILFAFLTYVFFVIQGRTYILLLIGTFLLYYYLNYSLKKFFLILLKIFLFVLFVIVVIQVIMPGYIEKMVNLFAQMFSVLGGEKSDDASANARIWQSLIVFNYFASHISSIWFGTGKVSKHWNDGYESIFGYFYPSDIGLIGGVFLYGVLGLFFLWIIPIVLKIKEIKKTKHTNNIFIVTIKYMLVLSILRSIQGGMYFGDYIWIVLLFILLAFNKMRGEIGARI